MRKTAALFALVLFVCATMAAEPWYQSEYGRVAEIWNVWAPVAFAGVTVAFLVVAVAYMIAIGFDLPELKMWAKSEFYQALASAVLVGGFLALTWVMLDEGMAKILGQNVNPFKMADAYLSDLSVKLQNLYRWNYFKNFGVEGISTISIYVNATGIDISPLAFLKPLIIEPLHLANYYVIQFLIIIAMWQGILNFFKTSAFATFLPLGVILRIFPPTRGAGGLLIAIAIGFFIVFPTMFAFIMMMTEEENALGEELKGEKASVGVDLAAFNACEHDIESAAKVAEEQTDPTILSKINTYYFFLPVIWLKILFYPLVVMAVTVTFIKVLSPLLGSDISEISQGLIRLI